MNTRRRAVDVAVYLPLGAVATLANALAGSRQLGPGRPGPSSPASTTGFEEERASDERSVPASPSDRRPTNEPGQPAPSELPIDDYDYLAASQVVDRLSALTADELAVIADYERAHRHRQTVLGRVAQLLS